MGAIARRPAWATARPMGRLIIVDEVSMVGQNMFGGISKRVTILSQNSAATGLGDCSADEGNCPLKAATDVGKFSPAGGVATTGGRGGGPG